MIMVVVKTLVIDPIWNTASAVVSTAESRLTTPVTLSKTSSPATIASDAPGTR